MKMNRYSLMLFLLCFSFNVWAIQSPTDFLENIANRVVSALNKNKTRLTPQVAYSLVNRIMLPHVDVTGMARSVLGRRAWNRASGAERREFSKAFTELVVRTYSNALSKYTDETVHFYPIRSDWRKASRIEVRSLVRRSGAPSIPISYRLIRKGGGWKVYDLSVEGVSLIISYRSQFAGEIRQGGMRQLIKKLKENNAR